jgi:transcriptional regulator with XRE-family HTH domain
VLERDVSWPRISTGLDRLDSVLGGLFRGDSVIWQRDGTPVEPFYRAIASQTRVFDTKVVVTLGHAVNTFGVPGLAVMHAARGDATAGPGEVLREIHRMCRGPGLRLMLFESLDGMARTWGVTSTCDFFARACPLLLDTGSIAYWSMSARDAPGALRDAVTRAGQCVLRVDERTVQVVKADGRGDDVLGTVLRWHEEGGRPVLAPPEIVDRVATSLRAIRRARDLSQHELGDLAGVSASAISQVERAERGLALGTAVRLSAALGYTVDGLLRGDTPAYRIGRRSDDPRRGIGYTHRLLGEADSDLSIELVHLEPRQAGAPSAAGTGMGILAVATGLVQVSVTGQTPAVGPGDVLVADPDRIEGWRNLGLGEAVAFWIVARGLGQAPT